MAWTIAVTHHRSITRTDGRKLYAFKIACTGDAGGASGDVTLSTELTTTYNAKESEMYMNRIEGGEVLCIEYVAHATVATEDPTITLDNENGTLFLSQAYGAAATSEFIDGRVQEAFQIPITDLIFTCTKLGDGAGKKATFYIWILK